MAHEMSMRVERGVLLVRVTGTRTREAVSAMAPEILEACIEHECNKVLIDVRDLKGRLSTFDSYSVVVHDFPKLRGKGLGKAAIVDRKRAVVTHWFFETVAKNRGYNVGLFEDPEEAMDWLGTAHQEGSSGSKAR